MRVSEALLGCVATEPGGVRWCLRSGLHPGPAAWSPLRPTLPSWVGAPRASPRPRSPAHSEVVCRGTKACSQRAGSVLFHVH